MDICGAVGEDGGVGVEEAERPGQVRVVALLHLPGHHGARELFGTTIKKNLRMGL